jgi:hypothetical protein
MPARNAARAVADVSVSGTVAVAMAASRRSRPQESSRAAKRASDA